MQGISKIILGILIFTLPVLTFGQGNIEDLLYTEVDNLNPVYKPVVGFGATTFNYFGEVQSKFQNPLNGPVGALVNMATFVDNKQYIRANFFFMFGAVEGEQRAYGNSPAFDPDTYQALQVQNMNFRSEMLVFGVNLNYDFDNFYKTYHKVHPYISAGIEMITFETKTDILGVPPGLSAGEGQEVRYQYWPDGTIRNLPYTPANIDNPNLTYMVRDKNYETVIRGNEDFEWGMGDYPQYSVAFPIEAGLDFWLSDRVLFRVGATYHLTLTDMIDHVSPDNTSGVIGKTGFDNFLSMQASLHLDLFSSKKTLTMQRLFADVELDLTLIGDEDNDGYMDGWDRCPGTPFGVETDTLGCALDDDYDGVPNYMDDEPNSRYGAYVDERGVEISEEDLITKLDMSEAVRREDVPLYLRTPDSYSRYQNITAEEIPDKFANVDRDEDGYISFDEILDEIDNYFDFESDLNSDDIYELNNFFFAQ